MLTKWNFNRISTDSFFFFSFKLGFVESRTGQTADDSVQSVYCLHNEPLGTQMFILLDVTPELIVSLLKQKGNQRKQVFRGRGWSWEAL